MAQPARAMKAPATLTLTYDPNADTWTVDPPGGVQIPRSGLVQFDIDPDRAPNCNIQCIPTTASASARLKGGGFTIGVGSGTTGGGKK